MSRQAFNLQSPGVFFSHLRGELFELLSLPFWDFTPIDVVDGSIDRIEICRIETFPASSARDSPEHQHLKRFLDAEVKDVAKRINLHGM